LDVFLEPYHTKTPSPLSIFFRFLRFPKVSDVVSVSLLSRPALFFFS